MTLLKVSPFEERFNYEKFDCGFIEVNDYLKSKAIQQEKERITKIHVVQKENLIIGYSGIFCSHLFLKLRDQNIEFRVPGICIGQLGVDREFQNKGIGKILIQHAISLVEKINYYSGCRIVFVDAYDNAIEYYQNLNFQLVQSKPNRNKMVLDVMDF